MPSGMLLPVPLLVGTRVVGQLEAASDGVIELHKFVDPARHQLRNPRGWSIAVEHLDLLRSHGGQRIVLEAPDGTRWVATLAEFDTDGENVGFRGYEAQRALRLPRWRVERPGEAVQLALAGFGL